MLPNSLELLANEDITVTYVGLLCLAEIFRTYRWKNNDERQDLEELILNYFPALLNYGANVLFQDGKYMNNEQIGELVKLIIKIYKFVSYHDLPLHYNAQNRLPHGHVFLSASFSSHCLRKFWLYQILRSEVKIHGSNVRNGLLQTFIDFSRDTHQRH